MKILPLALSVALIGATPAPYVVAADTTATSDERAARWKAIAQYIFGDRKIEPTDTLIKLDAPERAEDAALMPVTLTMPEKDKIKSVYLVIDDNPSPLAAHLTFGPAADPGLLQLRVRVDTYTNVHAVAETRDGRLFGTVVFVKASGGCSAPVASTDEEAMKGMGEMRMKFTQGAAPGKPIQATLMIRHPNFNGMQMDQVTRQYTPAHFIQSADVSYNGQLVFHLDSDISLSTDPVIGFDFVPQDKGLMKVDLRDSENMTFDHSFEIPEHAS